MKETEEYKKGFKAGYEQSLDDHHILHGEAAKKFIEQKIHRTIRSKQRHNHNR